jgi:hypothetical protein
MWSILAAAQSLNALTWQWNTDFVLAIVVEEGMVNARGNPEIFRDLKLSEVEKLTGFARATLYRKLREGTLAGRRISNGTWRVPPEEVDRLLAAPDPGHEPSV